MLCCGGSAGSALRKHLSLSQVYMRKGDNGVKMGVKVVKIV
jgi:hypothetical protein